MRLASYTCLGTKKSFPSVGMHEVWVFKVNEVFSCFDSLRRLSRSPARRRYNQTPPKPSISSPITLPSSTTLNFYFFKVSWRLFRLPKVYKCARLLLPVTRKATLTNPFLFIAISSPISHLPLLTNNCHTWIIMAPVKKTAAPPRKATTHPTFLSMIQVSSCFVIRVWLRFFPTRLRACLHFGPSLVHPNRSGKTAFEWLLIVNWAIWSDSSLHLCSNNYDIPMRGCTGDLTRLLPPM